MTRARPMVLLTALLAALLVGPVGAAAAEPAVAAFSVSGSPFAHDFAPLPTQATLKLTLSQRARVTVTIRRLNGTRVVRLAYRARRAAGTHAWTWNGRRSDGAMAVDGKFVARVVVETASAHEVVDRHIRKGLPPIYAANPEAIVVVVDPGHGGRFNNASGPGLLEKTANLDIGLRLQALLERAGVTVVMTRTTDVAVNDPPSDENGDGKLNRYDDDLERNDVANLALGDVNIHIHNNGSSNSAAHGTGTYTDRNRPFTPEATVLATYAQRGQVEALEPYRSAIFGGLPFTPRDRGVFYGWYYYMGPYDPPFLPRAALPVGILTESLFLSNPNDLEALKQPDVRLSIAAGIYLGIADYLNTRPFGAGYEGVVTPRDAVAGGPVAYRMRVTNRGNVESDGWRLRLGAVAAVPLYDGSGARGDEIGTVAVPDGLMPGQSIELEVLATAPGQAGDWLVKTDLVLDDGTYLSDRGVVSLQMPLRTTITP